MTAAHLGLELPKSLQIAPDLFMATTSVLLAFAVVLIKALKEYTSDYGVYLNARIPKEHQASVFQRIEEANPVDAFLLQWQAEGDDKEPFKMARFKATEYILKSSMGWFFILIFMPKIVSMYVLAVFLIPLPYFLYKMPVRKKKHKQLIASLGAERKRTV